MTGSNGVLPILLFTHGLICLATSATIFMSWLLGAFPTVPVMNASLAIAAAIAAAGVTSLLIASIQLIALEGRGRGYTSA